MAGSLIPNGAIGTTNIQYVTTKLDKVDTGLHTLSLTNYDSTSESAIAAGSRVEVNGAYYEFPTNETITGSPSDGTVYIMLIPNGSSITAQYTNTAPTWSDSKQGFYGTGANANYRYAEFVLYLDSSSWTKKERFNIYSETPAAFNAFGKHYFGDSASQIIPVTTKTTINFPTKSILQNMEYNAGIYTIKDKGSYSLDGLIYWSAATSNHCWYEINGVSGEVADVYEEMLLINETMVNFSRIINLEEGDTLSLQAYSTGSGVTVFPRTQVSLFRL